MNEKLQTWQQYPYVDNDHASETIHCFYFRRAFLGLARPVFLCVTDCTWQKIIFHYRTERECSSDTRIGDMDIPKGMLVQVPIYAIHYDPKIWPEPEKFNPYRFTSEEKAKRTAYDWLPFGSGPRNCIAMRLAQAEVKIAVAYLVRAYKFVRCEKTEVRILA